MPKFRPLTESEIPVDEPSKAGRPRGENYTPPPKEIPLANPDKYRSHSIQVTPREVYVGRLFITDTINFDDEKCRITEINDEYVLYKSYRTGATYSRFMTNFCKYTVKEWVE